MAENFFKEDVSNVLNYREHAVTQGIIDSIQDVQIQFGVVVQTAYNEKSIGSNDKGMPLSSNTGLIHVKLLDKYITSSKQETILASPINKSQTDYPVRGELVMLLQITPLKGTSTFYYISLVSINGNINNNVDPEIIKTNLSNVNMKSQDTQSLSGIKTSVSKPVSPSTTTDKNIDPTFVRNDSLLPLMPQLGHKVIEGRWGSSIRLGRNHNMFDGLRPSIKLRVDGRGLKEDPINKKYGIQEDILNDGNSIWITTGETLKLERAKLIKTKLGSVKQPSALTGEDKDHNLIQIKTDKYISYSTDTTEILSKKHICLASDSTVTVSAPDGISIKCDNTMEVTAPYVKLGAGGMKQITDFVPVGSKVHALLQSIIDTFNSHVHPVPSGMSLGPPQRLIPTKKVDVYQGSVMIPKD